MTKTTPEQNKAHVLEAFETLFNKRDYAAAERFWSDRYIQHSAHIACTAPGSLDKRLAYAARLKGWSCQAARASSGLRWPFFSISHSAL